MQLLPFAVLVLGLPVLLFCFLSFDDLVLFERTRHPAEWEKDHRPRPFLRKRLQFDASLRAWLATQRCSLTWLLVTPAWARTDPEASHLLRRHRTFVVCWCLLVVPAFALASALAAA